MILPVDNFKYPHYCAHIQYCAAQGQKGAEMGGRTKAHIAMCGFMPTKSVSYIGAHKSAHNFHNPVRTLRTHPPIRVCAVRAGVRCQSGEKK